MRAKYHTGTSPIDIRCGKLRRREFHDRETVRICFTLEGDGRDAGGTGYYGSPGFIGEQAPPPPWGAPGHMVPAFRGDVREHGNEGIVVADLPGLKKEGVTHQPSQSTGTWDLVLTQGRRRGKIRRILC
jgi:hypothetical protein